MPKKKLAMTLDDVNDLRPLVADLGLWNAPLGRVLDAMLLHLAHAHGLDTSPPEAPAEAPIEEAPDSSEAPVVQEGQSDAN
jgi:hypothetical protein